MRGVDLRSALSIRSTIAGELMADAEARKMVLVVTDDNGRVEGVVQIHARRHRGRW